ncbi:MAG: hypothetical protein RBR45_12930 [Pseudomonas sp.]|jgi:hypothetical protein|nr:hypothetical protein [Pseudomonas sp.]
MTFRFTILGAGPNGLAQARVVKKDLKTLRQAEQCLPAKDPA